MIHQPVSAPLWNFAVRLMQGSAKTGLRSGRRANAGLSANGSPVTQRPPGLSPGFSGGHLPPISAPEQVGCTNRRRQRVQPGSPHCRFAFSMMGRAGYFTGRHQRTQALRPPGCGVSPQDTRTHHARCSPLPANPGVRKRPATANVRRTAQAPGGRQGPIGSLGTDPSRPWA